MMKKEINSSMKKAFYGLDWTICFLWAIGVVVVGYGWFPYFPVNLVACFASCARSPFTRVRKRLGPRGWLLLH